ncbi:MAG: CAP domain-containing protein [Sediminibacterium sp.]
MKLKFVQALSVFIVIVGSAICSNANAQAFTTAQLDSANTAKSITQLSSEEKNVIKLINLARMYPKQFAKNYVAKYDEKATGYDYGADYAKDKTSLVTTLNALKPLKPLIFDNEMYDLAKCWCVESGKSGAIGHNRKTCKSGYNGECCSYGFSGALDIVMQLMIDNGVPGYGHRKIILTPYYTKIGIKNGSHKTYSFCSVIDFKL